MDGRESRQGAATATAAVVVLLYYSVFAQSTRAERGRWVTLPGFDFATHLHICTPLLLSFPFPLVESAVCDHIFGRPEQNRRVAVEWVAGGIFGSEKCSKRRSAQKRIRTKNATISKQHGEPEHPTSGQWQILSKPKVRKYGWIESQCHYGWIERPCDYINIPKRG